MAATRDRDSRVTEVTAPNGSQATAEVSDESIAVTVRCGEVLDEVVLRSYCIGAAHMAYGWVTNEGLAVDSTGEILNLTIRSFGVVRPGVMPPVTVTIIDDSGPAINGSDAVFAAVAGAVWRSLDYPTSWPCGALPFRGSVSE
jgi:CO/xanthine dehydrogenase Mo-binding subunit